MSWSTARRWWAALTARRGSRGEGDDDRAGMGTAFGLDASFEGWDDGYDGCIDADEPTPTRPAVRRAAWTTAWT